MKAPHHTNFYKSDVGLNNTGSILADFLYHTGWILQVYQLRSGDFKNRPGCPSCVEKRLIPYRGAKHVHDFINDMNVNVLPINATGQVVGVASTNKWANDVLTSDHGISGFTAAAPQMFDWVGHYIGESQTRNWTAVPSYSSQESISQGKDPLSEYGFDSTLSGPKHLRYVRHHAYSPNSGVFIDGLKDLGFWGGLKDREKWAVDNESQIHGIGCKFMKDIMTADHDKKIAKSKTQTQAVDQSNNPIAPFLYTGTVTCGNSDVDAQNLGFETLSKCNSSFSDNITTAPEILVKADDDNAAVEKAIDECKKWNAMRFGAGVKQINSKNCENANIKDIQKITIAPSNRAMPGWDGGDVYDTPDNPDPYAWAIHQMPISTNVLGGNDAFALKGQLYPVPRIGEICQGIGCAEEEGEAVSKLEAGGGATPRLNSKIDFINNHTIKFGAYFYSKIPKPYGFKDMMLETQGYRRNAQGWGSAKRCYPLAAYHGGNKDWLDTNMGYGYEDCFMSTVSQPIIMADTNHRPDQVAMADCPSWTNASIIGAENPGRNSVLKTNAKIGKNYLGCYNNKGERTCSDDDIKDVGKVELLTLPYKSIDKKYRPLHGTVLGADAIQTLLDKRSVDFRTDKWPKGGREGLTGWVANDDAELMGFKNQEATFRYAETVDELSTAAENRNLHTPHSYKYSYWWASPRNHIIIGDKADEGIYYAGGGGRFGKVGWDCALHTDMLDKDYLKCGLIANQRDDEEYYGGHCLCGSTKCVPEADGTNYFPDKTSCQNAGNTWSQVDEGKPWRWKEEAGAIGMVVTGHMHGVVPVARSHVIPIGVGYVPDPPITDFVPNREMPLHYNHDYSQQGGTRWATRCPSCDDGCWRSWLCSRADEAGGTWPSELACRRAAYKWASQGTNDKAEIVCTTDVLDENDNVVSFEKSKGWSSFGYVTSGGDKAKSEWHARKDMFNLTLQDLHLGMRQFCRYDGTPDGGGQWTGYNLDGRTDPTNQNWNFYPYGLYDDSMPVKKDWDSSYKKCCTDHCSELWMWTMDGTYGGPSWPQVGCDQDQINNGAGYGQPGARQDGSVVPACGYTSEWECRKEEAKKRDNGCGYDADILWNDGAIAGGVIKGLGFPHTGWTSGENVQYCKDRANEETSINYKTITAPSPPGMLETIDSFNSNTAYVDLNASLDQWEMGGYGNTRFLDRLGLVFLQNEDVVYDPFDFNWVKPFYGENAKFSYGWQKNINLRYKFEQGFQAWGSDVKGMTRPMPTREVSFSWSKAKGPGYIGGALSHNKTSPVLYHRRADVLSPAHYAQGGWPSTPIRVGQLSFPESNKNLRNIHEGMNTAASVGANRFQFYDLSDPSSFSNPNDVSMKYFFNTNRQKEAFAYRQPVCSSSYLTGDLSVGPFHTLYHPTGVMWTHPDIYLKEARLQHVLSTAKPSTAIDGTKEIIGYHREYSPVDSRYRILIEAGCGVRAVNRWADWIDIEGPSLITWDKHLHSYGPPRRAYEITGAVLPTDERGNSLAVGYWPGCRAVYAVMGYTTDDSTCRKNYHGATDNWQDPTFWLKYQDYCPKLKFLRWNGEEPHDYYNERWKSYTKPCYECAGGKWALHKDAQGNQKYPLKVGGNGELDCRRGDSACGVCDETTNSEGITTYNWKSHTDNNGIQKFASEAACRRAACEGTDGFSEAESCCGRCDIETAVRTQGDSNSYREMDIVPSGYPYIDCNGAITNIVMFQSVKSASDASDSCQKCTNYWDDGTMDGKGEGDNRRPDRGGGTKGSLPHFYDHKPIMTIEPPKLWPPPPLDTAGWAGSLSNTATSLDCNVDAIDPAKWLENHPETPSSVNLMPLVHESWTGVALTSGVCQVETATDQVKMEWPLAENAPMIHPVLYSDPNWYGNSNDTYEGHRGTDMFFHGADVMASSLADNNPPPQSMWDDMVNNPVDILAVAPGKVIQVVDEYKDQCIKWLRDHEVHGEGGTKCDGEKWWNQILIDHGETNAGYRYTAYVHIQKESSYVEEGDDVVKGQKLAKVGSAGRSGWPHLHFAVGLELDVDQNASNLEDGIKTKLIKQIEPFNLNPSESLWADQCALPIYNKTAVWQDYTEPTIPLCVYPPPAAMGDSYLDFGHADIATHFMAERNCADHNVGCCKLDWALSTTSTTTAGNFGPGFHAWYHLPVDKACHLRVNIASKAHNHPWSDIKI
jgi:hypothetical protein